jgi:Spy/CpxP family protein refolding chaperone
MKPKLIILACFLSAFGAGLCVGVLWQQPAKAAQDHWLSELNLTPEQREKIKAIWTDAMKNSSWQNQREKRDSAQKQREEALNALITPEQKLKYDEIQSNYQKQLEVLSQESRKSKDEAYEKTKAILNDEQRVAYEEMRKKRMEGRSRSRGDSSKATGGAAADKISSEKKTEETQQSK